jgi:hypothetical protein
MSELTAPRKTLPALPKGLAVILNYKKLYFRKNKTNSGCENGGECSKRQWKAM